MSRSRSVICYVSSSCYAGTECCSATLPLIPVTSCKISINFPYFIEKGGKVAKLVDNGVEI